jgi:putative heme-binding domain-containing protein
VQRAAIELLTDYPEMSSVEAALLMLRTIPAHDTHLVYTSRLILRNLLRENQVMKQVVAKEWSEEDAGFIAGTLVDVPSPEAAIFLDKFLADNAMQKDKTQLAYQQIARFIPLNQLEAFMNRAKASMNEDVDRNAQIFGGIKDGLAQRGGDAKAKLMESWGSEIAESLLKAYPASYDSITNEIISRQNYAILLAGDYRVKSATSSLNEFIKEEKVNADLKANALKSLLKISPDKSTLAMAVEILTSETTSNDLKKRVASILGESPGPAVNEALINVKKASADLEAVIATALAGSSEGKDLVFNQVRSGAFMSRTLIDPRVEERILTNISAQQRKEYEQLIANIEPISTERQTLIDQRLAAFKQFKQTSTAQLDSGSMIYNANCNVCHRKYTMSGIGPQLHGIGKRGAEALAEKILDPNRNISEAFRNFTINLKDGKVLSGIYRREEGAVIIFGDLNGKEFSVPKINIASQTPSRYTIMPDHFGSTLSQQQFNLLLNYLLTW